MNIDTRRARLVALHHIDRSSSGVPETTRDLVALHSSDPLTPHLALWARIAGYRPSHLDPADVWRGHAMRRTLWVALADDVAALHAAVGATVAARERRRLEGWVQGRTAWLVGVEAEVLRQVREHPGVTTRELTSRVPELATPITVGSGKWTQEVAVGSRMLHVLALELKVARAEPSGSWRSSQYGWVPFEVFEPLSAREARAWLVGRYLQRFGPVTSLDARWWTGLTASQVDCALSDAGAVPIDLDDGPAWLHPDAHPEAARGVALLPGLDPTPMGYKDRTWFLGPHGPRLFDRNGNVGPTIWQDGRIVGGWSVVAGQVRTKLLEEADDGAIDAEAAALTEWLAGASVSPRFPTPLEKELRLGVA